MVERDEEHDEVDEASEESFPASDPPAWEPSHVGAPAPQPTQPTQPKPDSRLPGSDLSDGAAP